MSEALNQIIKLAQKCVEQVPVVVLGSGASAQYGVGGMGALQKYLLSFIKPGDEKEKEIWAKFSDELVKSGDLEVALHNVQLPSPLETRVVKATRDMVLKDDLSVLQNMVQGKVEFALSALLKFLLRTTHRTVQIVTTNYDRIAEYACDAANVQQSTGFRGGCFRLFQSTAEPKSLFVGSGVEILKVHGSVDWFIDAQQTVIALPDSVSVPDSHIPLLVTPGTGKYLATHEEPFRTIISRSDAAFASARSALCVGYGFNDRHIQPKMTNRVLKDKIPTVILAQTLTPKTKEFLARCKHQHFLALEMSGTGSRAFHSGCPGGMELPEPIWELGAFVEAVAGKQ